jgi:signal transduction histidine kinase
MIQLVDSAVATTRKIVTDLRPSILDDLGLAAALRWQIGEYENTPSWGFISTRPIRTLQSIANVDWRFSIFQKQSPTWRATPTRRMPG